GPLTDLERRNRARRQEIQYEFTSALDAAKQAANEGRLADANDALTRARVARNADTTLWTEPEIRTMETQLANVQLDVTRVSEESARREAQSTRDATARAIAQAQAQADADRRHTVADLISQARR